jgi:hypothetical protein
VFLNEGTGKERRGRGFERVRVILFTFWIFVFFVLERNGKVFESI